MMARVLVPALAVLACTAGGAVGAQVSTTMATQEVAAAHGPAPGAVTVATPLPVRVRPAWVVGDVPDTVWMLVEHAVTLEPEATKSMLREAEARAREALVGHEESVGRHFALAAVLGMRADREGGRTKVAVAAELFEELETIMALDPDHASSRYMLGRLHAGVRRMNGVTRWLATNLLGGSTLKQASWQAAEEHLSFAEHRAPGVPDHHLQLARLYLDTDRRELAMAELEHVLRIEPTTPLEHEAVAEAAALWAELRP